MQTEEGIRVIGVTGVKTCVLPIYKIVAKCKQRQASHPSKRNPRVIVKVGHHLEYSNASRASAVLADNSQHVLKSSLQGLRRSELLKGTLRRVRGEQQRSDEGLTSAREGRTAAKWWRVDFGTWGEDSSDVLMGG